MSEEHDLLLWARDQCRALNLLVRHQYDSRRDADWSPGFPDLFVASRTGHGILAVELKSSGANLDRDQQVWRRAFEANTTAPTWLLARPADREGLRARLQMLAMPPAAPAPRD